MPSQSTLSPRVVSSGGRGANLQSVADAAGVHRSTAARALDPAQSHRISPEVVERVRGEARRQGYRRDAIAASLRTGRSRLVGVVLPDLHNPVFALILNGIGNHLAAQGYSMLVAYGADEDAQTAIMEQLIARRVDGLLLATARRHDAALQLLIDAGVPTVLVNRGEDDMRMASVVSNDRDGMVLAVEHLVGLGHRRIGHLAGPESLSTGHRRREGFEAAMATAGLASDAIVPTTAYSRDAGRAATCILLDRHPDLTAVVAANDLLALGAYLEFQERGIDCPDDISIVGHNDMPFVDMLDPPLTTVRIGHLFMGSVAAELLIQRIDHPGLPPVQTIAPTELIVRGSTAVHDRARLSSPRRCLSVSK